MNHTIKNESILIIGGATHMGLAIAKVAMEAGASIILSSRSSDKLDMARKELGEKVLVHAADATQLNQLEAMFKIIGQVNHLVITASVGARAGSIPDTSPEIMKQLMDRFWILYNVLHLAKQYVNPRGSITALSGSSGRRPGVGFGTWSALHGSIEALMRPAALELAPIRINTVSPGGIGRQADRQLVHHHGKSEDIASMVLALILNPAITNALIDIDGGERLGNWLE